MAIGITARPSGYSSGTATTTSSTASTAAGSTLAVWVCFGGGTTISSVADVAGNSYTAFGGANIDSGSGILCRLYICQNAAAHASNAVTVTRSGTSGECTFLWDEITGAATSSIDSTAQASGLATHNGTANTQSVTTADQAAEIIVSWAFEVIQADADLAPTGASFTHLSDVIDAGGYNLGCAYRIVAATGSYNALWDTIFDNSIPVATVGFKEAGAAAANHAKLLLLGVG